MSLRLGKTFENGMQMRGIKRLQFVIAGGESKHLLCDPVLFRRRKSLYGFNGLFEELCHGGRISQFCPPAK